MSPYRHFTARTRAGTRRRVHRSALLVLFFALVSGLLARPVFADPHTEAAAKEAIGKVQNDYLMADYAGAAARLKLALHACGPKNCAPLTRAMLLRDLGTMQFRSGDKEGASKSFSDALAIQPTLLLDPNYDAADVGAAYEDARAVAGLPAGPVSTKPPPGGSPAPPAPPAGAAPGGAPAPGARSSGAPPAAAAPAAGTPPQLAPIPMGDQPSGGDFVHEPPLEQRENTPLPIYVEYPGQSQLGRVVVKYKGAQMRDWQRIELRREGKGWVGLVPCADVTRGVIRYWIQGFDKTQEPVAATGDPKHPFYVPIRDKITGEAPRLPGKDPPRSCEETDCPPGIPGCKSKKGDGGETAAGGAAPAEGGASDEAIDAGDRDKLREQAGDYPRLWIGGGAALDFVSLPSATDVCSVKNTDATPTNSAGYYCFGFDPARGANSNFPTSTQENNSIASGGSAPGGLALGNLRVMGALDYAISPNILAGARVGYVFNAYLGRGAAFPAKLHVEARGTFVFGRSPLSHGGLAPMVFVGLGVSQFDGHTTTHDLTIRGNSHQQTEDAWLSDGPFFVAAGIGLRLQFSRRVAITAAARVNMATGPVGLLPTFGPEAAMLFGF